MKILVVDDELNNLSEIKELIARTGEEVEAVFFTDPAEALETAKSVRFDAALLDIQMPGMTGLELAERLVNRSANMEIVFITAYNHYATEAFEANAIDYLLKPLRYERFEKTFQKLCNRKQDEPASGDKLIIRSFGEVKVFSGEREIKWNRPKNYELFCFLFLNKEKRIHKETICEALWPDLELNKALPNLQVTMSRLRKDLGIFERKQIFVEYSNHHYSIRIPDGSIDLDIFRENAKKEDKKSLVEAIELYTDDFLEREGWLWALDAREAFSKEYETAAIKLGKIFMREQEYEKVLALFDRYMKTGMPNEELSKMYLKAVCYKDSLSGQEEAFLKITKWYQRELNMEVPEEIKAIYEQRIEEKRR